jgi:hypothetical protein
LDENNKTVGCNGQKKTFNLRKDLIKAPKIFNCGTMDNQFESFKIY